MTVNGGKCDRTIKGFIYKNSENKYNGLICPECSGEVEIKMTACLNDEWCPYCGFGWTDNINNKYQLSDETISV